MATLSSPPASSAAIREARVGQLLGSDAVPRTSARRLEAAAVIVPGTASLAEYAAQLEERVDDFAAWDGRVVIREPDGQVAHRLAIVDRYGQVYAVTDATDASDLPDAAALEEWFRFLATACPECGVLDDPIGRGWVP